MSEIAPHFVTARRRTRHDFMRATRSFAYLVGNALTIADFSVAALAYAKEAELPVAPYPHLRDWLARVSALPAWSTTAPQRPPAAA